MATTEKKTAATKPETYSYMYIGPTIPSGRLSNNRLLFGRYKDIINQYTKEIEEYPAIKNLILSVDGIAAASHKIKQKGNSLNAFYAQIESQINTKGQQSHE